MALPTTRINLRSPYYINLERAALEKIVVELYIYTGTLTTDKPADYNYRTLSTAFLISSGNRYAEVDISELARDYVDVAYAGSFVSNAVWIEWDLYYADIGDTSLTLSSSTKATGINGYGWFEDGYNPAYFNYVMMTNSYVLAPTKKGIKIPVLQDNLTQVRLARGGLLLYNSGALTPQEETANVVYYVDTTLGKGKNPDRAILNFGSASQIQVKIKYFEECKNENIKLTFVNRFGALQDIWLYGKSSFSLNTRDTKYKRNLLDGGDYNVYRHQNKILEKNGTFSVTLNSGFYPEEMNAVFNELLHSENVWIEVRSELLNFTSVASNGALSIYPVNITSSNFQFKQQIYDKLINYTFDVEFAADRINSVR